MTPALRDQTAWPLNMGTDSIAIDIVTCPSIRRPVEPMTLLLISSPQRISVWRKALGDVFPDEEILDGVDFGDRTDINIVIMGPPVEGLFARLPNLQLVISQRAGIDDLIADPDLAPDVAVCRAQDLGGDRMLEDYALLLTLFHHRNMVDFLAANQTAEWLNPGVLLAKDRRVGVMGLGVLGIWVARRLRDAGFATAGWARTPRTEPGVDCFHGADQLDAFLNRTEILVNMLAVTPETTNIINEAALAKLPKGAAIINLGRGEHIVDDDLIAAINSGHIDSASLDAFRTEPLPADHPFWKHPRITVLPHTARRPLPEALTAGIIENIRRFKAGEPLLLEADRTRGY
jgi:glyoxylate/hydroxypyruvate reductase A